MTLQLFVIAPLTIILTMAGGVIPLLRRWKEDHLHGFVSFGAGILIATAFLHLLPDALERAQPLEVGYGILGSFLFLFILEKFVMLHPCEETHCNYHTMGWAAYVGMLIHNFFDGLALGAASMVDSLIWVVFLAIMAHKIPSSFSLASILKKAEWSTRRILLFLFIFALTIPLGAIVAQTLLAAIGDRPTGLALALSLGTFIYISTSDFLPEVHRPQKNRLRYLACFLAGLGLMALLTLVVPKTH